MQVTSALLGLLLLSSCVGDDGLPISTTDDLAAPLDAVPPSDLPTASDSSSPPDLLPPNLVEGTLDGVTFQPAAAISTNAPYFTGGPTLGFVYLVDRAQTCQLLGMSPAAQPQNLGAIQIVVGEVLGSMGSPPLAPGTFPIGNGAGNNAIVRFLRTDASCVTVVREEAVQGSVTLTSIANGVYSGSFDVTMPQNDGGSADHLSGRFQAEACAGLASLVLATPPIAGGAASGPSPACL
jgi:hypothetical protein